MSFLGFGARGKTPNKFGSIQIQTSEKGVPIPYAAGTVKLPIKLLDYVDFNAQGQSQGGKGGGGITSFLYYASFDAAGCMGPVDGIGNVYDTGGASSLASITETYTVPSGGGTFVSTFDTTENDEGVTYIASYTFTANDFGSDGSTTVTGTHAVPMQKVLGTPAAHQYAVAQIGGSLNYTFAAADVGKVVSITYTYSTDSTNFLSPAAKYNLGVMPGLPGGSVWGYMLASHPERALSYPGIARITAQNFGLGSSATPPNVSAEFLNCRGLAFGGGIADCDPAAIITDICTDAKVGFNWPFLADLSAYSNYCVANNLFMSPATDAQVKGLSLLGDIIKLTNSEAVWSGGALKIVPYGDQTAVDNGRTFTPATTPAYDIELVDLVGAPGKEPIISSWKGLADNYNVVQFQYTRRDANYNTDVITDKDEASILMNGLLPAATITGDFYRETNNASIAANLLLKRNSVALMEHRFTLKWWYFLLEPMDIIRLMPLGGRPVRIVSIEENEDYSLSVVAEDFLFGVAQGTLYPRGAPAGAQTGAHARPGNAALLAAFQPNTRVTGGANQLWLALSGGANWGGANVWISKDGTSYAKIPDPRAVRARAGSLTAPVAAGTDPDTTGTISISLNGALTTGTTADADVFATLCLMGNELISFSNVDLTGTSGTNNLYDLNTYIRRGVFANNSSAHSAGERFVRLDDTVKKYTIDPALAGGTVYLKFTSVNLFGFEEQGLDDVTAVTINLGGPVTASNMTVGSFLNSGGTTATVDVYLLGGSPGDPGSVTLPNGALVTLPATAYTSEATGTWYGVNYNPATSAYVLYTDMSAWAADQATMVGIGSTTTPATGTTTSTPTLFFDSGATTTYNPSGAYTTGQEAEVSSQSTWTPPEVISGGWSSPDDGDEEDYPGLATWYGWSGTTTATKTLSITAAVTRVGPGTSFNSVSYTLDGSTWTTLFSTSLSVLASATYTASIPSGTNLALVQVQASSYCAVTTSTHPRTVSSSINISDLGIA